MQQALERQIVFEDHKEAYALLGDRDEFLQVLRENFDCQFISRGEQLEILGEAAEVKMAATLVEELQYLYRQGTTITMHEVRYGIGLVRGGKGEALHTLFGDTILVTSRGRHVRPKTLGQRLYLDTIRHNSITFGIGPAGTGKTYLAVVMAVAALRNKEVRRIILTRPAVEAGERLGFLPGDLQDKVDPYLRPLYDALQDILGQDSYQKLRMVLGAVTEYALLDLDGDGTDECIFWGEGGNSSLYTMKDGKTAPVLTEGDKAFGIWGTVSLCENNVLKTYEEVGQAYKLYCFYTVEHGNLIVQNRLVYDIANDCFGLSLSGIHIVKDLSREEAETLLNSYREVPLEHLPIDTLPEEK